MDLKQDVRSESDTREEYELKVGHGQNLRLCMSRVFAVVVMTPKNSLRLLLHRPVNGPVCKTWRFLKKEQQHQVVALQLLPPIGFARELQWHLNLKTSSTFFFAGFCKDASVHSTYNVQHQALDCPHQASID